ncbi:putative ribonuclease H-like domain-containing protein, partial [Tanacetum coccineum]
FQRGKIDKTLFIRRDKSDILLVQVYVDDIIFGSTTKSLCTDFEKMMHKKFQMSSMGELTFFLGLDVKTASTPMETHKPLLKDVDGEDVDEHLYRSMIGSLMYLTSSRPDIMFVVCACTRFQVNPKVSHLHTVKRIFRYLKGQPKLGLWYPKNSPFDLVAYTDSDYAGESLDRKSTTGDEEWKSKLEGVVMQEPSETATRPTVPPQQHDPKDKGKGKMVKQEKPLKKKDQIKFDEEIAQRLRAQIQAELEEEERLAREREEDANIAEWDNAQAMMDADYELAAII